MSTTVPLSDHLSKEEKQDIINNAKLDKKVKKLTSKKLGFTNKLAIYLLLLLTFSLVLGFYLALRSIDAQYTGALVCWSCVVAPLDACLGIVLVRVVEKSRAENIGAGGVGISFAAAEAAKFGDDTEQNYHNSKSFREAMDYAAAHASEEYTNNTDSVFATSGNDEDAFATAEEATSSEI